VGTYTIPEEAFRRFIRGEVLSRGLPCGIVLENMTPKQVLESVVSEMPREVVLEVVGRNKF